MADQKVDNSAEMRAAKLVDWMDTLMVAWKGDLMAARLGQQMVGSRALRFVAV
jgi:hypothetical protein